MGIPMTVNNKTSQDFMSIRTWLQLAALGLVGLAVLSSIVLFGIASDVRNHAEHLRQSTRLQSFNAELGRDVTRAWLYVNSGDHLLAVPALAEMRKQRKLVRDIIDDFHGKTAPHPPKAQLHGRMNWEKMHRSLSELINIAQPIVTQSRRTVSQTTPPNTLPIDHPAYKDFMEHLRATIATCRFAGAESYANVRWVLQNLCTMTLAIIAAMAVYGLFFFLFVSSRIGTRTADVTSRVLHYTSGLQRPPDYPPRSDEFGRIEARVDDCAQTIRAQQMAVAQKHEKTMQQLNTRTEELGKLNEALRASGRALVKFLTDVSHDLRTPLAIMVGESEVSLRSQSTSPDEYKETLSRMLDQTRYLGSLVDQLLYTARSRVSAVPLQPDYVDVPELVRNACRDMTTLAANQDITIELKDSSTRRIVLGDHTRLREMLLTILDNAIEYSQPNGAINVSVSEQGTNLKIAVADTGIGIPANEIPMIFRRFYRAQNAPDANAQGTGIGLAVAKGIVESHDGAIDIDSQENQGTTVTLTLPLTDKQKGKETDHDALANGLTDRSGMEHLTTV